MKAKHYVALYASVILGIFSLLLLGGEKAPEATNAAYWTVKGIALLGFGLSFLIIKSIEDKFPDN